MLSCESAAGMDISLNALFASLSLCLPFLNCYLFLLLQKEEL